MIALAWLARRVGWWLVNLAHEVETRRELRDWLRDDGQRP